MCSIAHRIVLVYTMSYSSILCVSLFYVSTWTAPATATVLGKPLSMGLDHQTLLHHLPLLTKACVRQAVLDK